MKKQLLTFSAIALTGVCGAYAQDTSDSGQDEKVQLDTIIVEAQRREQSILEVPVAVTSYSGETLEARRVEDIADLNFANPSVHISSRLSDTVSNSPIRIRGFGTGGGNPGFEGAVGLFYDDVFRSRPGAALASFFDVGGLEVLRGPQGTLFGKNTTAGAIVIRSNRPDFDGFSAGITAEAGNLDTYEAEGFVNFVLSDTVAARVAGVYNESDGAWTRISDGEATDWTKNKGFRASLAWEPTDSLAFDFIFDYTKTETPGGTGRSTALDNRNTSGLAAFYQAQAAAALDVDPSIAWYFDPSDPNSQTDPFSYKNRNNFNGKMETETYGWTIKGDFQINDSTNLRSITGIRQLDFFREGQDVDFGPTDYSDGYFSAYDIQSFSQEFILAGELGLLAGIDWTVGANYFDEEIQYDQNTTSGNQLASYAYVLVPTLDPAVLPPSQVATGGGRIYNIGIKTEEQSLGIFGHSTVNITDQFSVVGGVRWNQIEKDGAHENKFGSPTEYWDYIFGNQAFFYFLGGNALSSPDWDASLTNEELTYDVALQWNPTDTTQIYAKYARGFKAGGINMAVDAVDSRPALGGPNIIEGRSFTPLFPDAATFDPEFVDAYEIGARWNYPGGLLNITAFQMDYEDLQVATFDGTVFKVVNAGTSESNGIEIENSYQLTDNISTNIGVTWLNEATYGDDVIGLPAGRRRAHAPEFAGVFNAQYTQPINSVLEGFVNFNYAYQGETFVAEGEAIDYALSLVEQDAYHLVGLTAGIRSPDGDWEAALWCENCFEEEYYEWAFNHVFHFGVSPLVTPAYPRTWGRSFEERVLRTSFLFVEEWVGGWPPAAAPPFVTLKHS